MRELPTSMEAHTNGIDVHGVGSNFKSESYNILNLQTDTNDDQTSTDGIFKITNGSAGTTKAEFRWDESEDAVQIAYGDHGRHIVIKSDGNVGIGQTNPDARLDLGTLNSATAGQDQTLQMGAFGFRHQDTGGFNHLYLERNYGGWQATPVLTARADGNIGIGTNSPATILHAYGSNPTLKLQGIGSGYTEGSVVCEADNSYRGGGIFMYNGNGASTDTEWFAGRSYANSTDYRINFKSNPTNPGQDTSETGNTKFRLYTNGNYSFTGSNVSDRRMKQDIVDETSQLANVLALDPKTFRFKPETDVNGDLIEGAEPSPTQHGLIAQEVLDVLPNLVTGNPDVEEERLGVDYQGLTSVLVKAIQEQQALIDSLTARITALES